MLSGPINQLIRSQLTMSEPRKTTCATFNRLESASESFNLAFLKAGSSELTVSSWESEHGGRREPWMMRGDTESSSESEPDESELSDPVLCSRRFSASSILFLWCSKSIALSYMSISVRMIVDTTSIALTRRT